MSENKSEVKKYFVRFKDGSYLHDITAMRYFINDVNDYNAYLIFLRVEEEVATFVLSELSGWGIQP